MKFSHFVLIALAAAALGYFSHDSLLPALGVQVQPQRSKAASVKATRVKPAAPKATAAAPAAPEPEEAAPADEPALEEEVAVAAAEEPEAPAAAAEEAPPAKPKAAAPGSMRVADALAGLTLVNECTPNAEARYYIYLLSAGWCGPCNHEMPNVVKAYEEMKESGLVELILVDFDEKPEQARAYMAKHGATFPAIMQQQGAALPGIQPPAGIPTAIIVDEMGNQVAIGHGSISTQWKKHITDYETKAGLPLSITDDAAPVAQADEADAKDEDAKDDSKAKKKASNAVARSLSKVKWAKGKPNKKAEYYIYLQSASWCGPCRAEMPTIASEYKEMKKDGRVELVLISFDRTENAAKQFLSANKAAFPMTLRNAKGVDKLEGFTMAQGIPTAIIVDASGKVITQGHGSIVKEWRRFTIEAKK